MASDGEISCTNDPNFAAIYSFLKVFGKLYGLEIPSIAKLQQLVENTEEVGEVLKELHLRLLRRAQKSVQSSRWERCLIKFCHQQGHHQEAWEIERFSYKKASTEVKLKTLKILLEYQFTCHTKFKAAVNALSCKELRLDPIGRDKNGCVFWLQVDDDANLCLYKEDQDEETWQLIARNREQLVNVITKLKSGEEICPSSVSNTNEDSSSTEIPPATEVAENTNTQPEEENEEFLSPESESEHDDDESKANKKSPPSKPDSDKNEEKVVDKEPVEPSEKIEDTIIEEDHKVEDVVVKEAPELEDKKIEEQSEKTIEQVSEKAEGSENENSDQKEDVSEEKMDSEVAETPAISTDCQKSPEPEEKPESPSKEETSEIKDPDEVSEAIEEPVMVVTGEGSGADCESSYFIGEEICEPVMYFYGEGCGYDNDTGNPVVLEEASTAQHNSDEENDNDECVNGEHSNSVNDISNSNKSKLGKTVKLKSGLPAVNKRSLKKQSNDNSEVLKPDSKKHCIRKPNRSDSLKSNSSNNENDLKRESSVNDKTTDSESPNKNNIKKSRGKVKKKPEATMKLKLNQKKELTPTSDADNCNDNKASIIEKRKSSVSSDQDGVDHTENEKEGSPEEETKVEDDLPPKKLRLEPTPKDIDVSHSKEKDTVDNVNNDEANVNNENNDSVNTEHPEKDPIAMRKKIKANKGKFKRKKILQNKLDNSDVDKSTDKTEEKSKSKPLKRSLLDATNSDKNKSESQSESEDDMPITSGKRLKIKPKKIITTSRKKVEAKLLEKKSSDDSEEETLYSIAGKKTGKKILLKKPKGKEKAKSKGQSEDSDATPVRASRRIAQQKIKEEADRRHLEEVALRELKMIHKKGKSQDDEEEWRASGSSSGSPVRRRPAATWRAQDSSDPDSDSDRDELSDRPEPDLEFGKSDHEFSPESDLETGEPSEPLKRARTLQEGADDGFCKHCGSGEQPEWILLCDQCDAGYHASCLKPMLFLVPEGDWFCPPCNHAMLISSLESELVKYDELLVTVEAERARAKELELQRKPPSVKNEEKGEESDSGSGSGWSSSSSSGAVYRLRARRQLPVSYRAQEYDRLISSAIKEEYVEPTTSAGNQGRGKDISTIIEAAEEEKLKAEREEAIAQGKPIVEIRKKKKQRRKPRKLNSLEVVSEDDGETDEDFKDTGMESSSEDISSSAERDSTDSRSSDSRPIRRAQRTEKKDRPKLRESSPEVKKKKGEFAGSSSESSGAKEWPPKIKSKSKSRHRREKHERRDKRERRETRDKSRPSKHKKPRGLQQYDAMGNVIRARVTYGGLSDDSPNDWSPKHRTRQKKINYTEMPNTESEDEMHKGSGKHMPDSSDEFKMSSSSSESSRGRSDPRRQALSDLIRTAVVPLEKLPDDVTRAKEEELQVHLNAQAASNEARPARGKGGRGGRGTRGPRGRGRGGGGGGGAGGAGGGAGGGADDALAKLVGVKIKDLGQEPIKPNQIEREKKRQEREAKLAEKEAKRIERIQKKEEKDKMKEQKAKEREEKRLAKLALQESKRMKKEKPEYPISGPVGYSVRPDMRMMYPGVAKHAEYPGAPGAPGPEQQRYPAQPRLQVRAELRGVPVAGPMSAVENMREGTLSVAGSPQPFKPVSEEPSVITRMPHMLNQYRGPMMYPSGNSPYGPRPQNMMYVHHPGLPQQRPQYPPQYYGLRALPPGYRLPEPASGANHNPGHLALGSRLLGTPGSSHGPHGPPGSSHGPPGPHGPPGSSHGPPGSHGPHGLPGLHGPPGSHGPPGLHGPPGPHGPPVSSHGPMPHRPPSTGHGPSGPHGPPGSSHGPPGSTHGLPGSHGPPGSNHGPLGVSHGPPGSTHGLPGSHAPPGSHGPPGSNHGPLGSSHGPPGLLHGPPRPGSHGPPVSSHGPMHGPPPGSPHTSALHGLLRAGPPVQLQGLRPPGPLGLSPHMPGLPHPGPPSSASPVSLPPGSSPNPTPPPKEPPIKIKAEVKTEPEYHSPVQSPPRASPEPPRHPKIKHTENKERRPRYPLGPYAPQYGPYGPYAPPEPGPPGLPRGPSPLQRMHHNLHQFLPEAARPPRPEAPPYLPVGRAGPPYSVRPPASPPRPEAPPYSVRPPASPPRPEAPPYLPAGRVGPPYSVPRPPASPPAPAPAPSPAPRAATPAAPEPPKFVKTEPPAEGSVFGGLVSYFSSQHDDELDA